jgi:hypothetical protein
LYKLRNILMDSRSPSRPIGAAPRADSGKMHSTGHRHLIRYLSMRHDSTVLKNKHALDCKGSTSCNHLRVNDVPLAAQHSKRFVNLRHHMRRLFLGLNPQVPSPTPRRYRGLTSTGGGSGD